MIKGDSNLRQINLCSYADAFTTLEEEQFKRYLDYFGIQVKAQESEDICTFIQELLKHRLYSDQLSDFFIGYSIPQIPKEFDLLRFGDNYILDIELKNISSEERIKKQLIQNSYYLNALGTPVLAFAYVVQTQEVFTLDENGVLVTSTLEELVAAIDNQQSKSIYSIDALFKPSVYLVSPLNSTEKFISGNYFLTDNQLAAKNDIIRIFAESDDLPYIAIEGKPGTGKTLLTYDIAKHYIDQGWNVRLFHCGNLSQGHWILHKEHSWNIAPIKEVELILQEIEAILPEPQQCDLIIIDEAQRIRIPQFQAIIDYVAEKKIHCIFSFDPEQVMSSMEASRNIAGRIEQLLHKKYKLTEKIRTNKEIAAFITNLFDRNKINHSIEYKNIKLQYFDTEKSLRHYLEQLKDYGWEVIDYTTSSYYQLTYDRYQVGRRNAHNVIGQEFDKVAAVINQHFFYDSDGCLMSRKESGAPAYRLDRMLYQMLTRARQEITVIVYKNKPLLEACLKILGR